MANVYVRSLAGGTADGSSWANAYLTLAAAMTAKAAGDDFWVSEDHAETQASAMTITSPGTAAAPCRAICVDHLGTAPPVSADLRTTATIETTGANSLSVGGTAYWYGITFNCGTGAGAASLLFGVTAAGWHRLDSCKLVLAGTTSTNTITFAQGGASLSSRVELVNTTVKFAHVSQGISLRNTSFEWRHTAAAIDVAGSIPTSLFLGHTTPYIGLCKGVDFSAMGAGKALVAQVFHAGQMVFQDCKIDNAVTKVTAPGSALADIYFSRTDGSGTNYKQEKYSYLGTLTTNLIVVRAGGASDGATNLSWKGVTTANSKWFLPFRAMPALVWNAITAANITVTLHGVYDGAALPKNDEFWFNVEYLGSAATPLGSILSGTKADALAAGSNLTADTASTWDGGATARANSTAYVVGDVIKLASNAGRIFFCTTAGTSNGSEPAGYASAVDGGSVTDNTAVFRAGMRFKQALTASSPQPAQAGLVYVHARIAIPSSTFYIDPKPVLS